MSYKSKLILFLGIQATLTIVYRVFEVKELFTPTLVFGGFLVLYAFSIKCPTCKRGQVIRSMSIFDIKFPGEECYYCKTPIKPKKE